MLFNEQKTGRIRLFEFGDVCAISLQRERK
jgi:hypothetical protein